MMPSFFLSETLKYLYLLFEDDDHWLHSDPQKWVFSTEGHLFAVTPDTGDKMMDFVI